MDIAIVGSGTIGLTYGWLLSKCHGVTHVVRPERSGWYREPFTLRIAAGHRARGRRRQPGSPSARGIRGGWTPCQGSEGYGRMAQASRAPTGHDGRSDPSRGRARRPAGRPGGDEKGDACLARGRFDGQSRRRKSPRFDARAAYCHPGAVSAALLRRVLGRADVRTMVDRHMRHGIEEWIAGYWDVVDAAARRGVPIPHVLEYKPTIAAFMEGDAFAEE